MMLWLNLGILRVTFGETNFETKLRFIEEALGAMFVPTSSEISIMIT